MSKLPGDVKRRKEAAEEVIRTLDPDLREKKIERISYSHKIFRRAAVEWLVATDQVSNSFFLCIMILIFSQPIQALEHTKFKELIDIASRATNGVEIPRRKITRGEIIRLFKEHLTKLKTQLNVYTCELPVLDAYYPFLIALQGPTVQGEVSLTCDAWQASNTDGYFAVTAHWIEEPTSTKWELKSALIGFTRLNNAHNGERLGQALFKVIERIGIGHKVSLLGDFGQYFTLFIICCKGWPRHMRQCEQQHNYDEGAGCAFEYQYWQDVSLEKAESQVRQFFNSFTSFAHKKIAVLRM